MAQRDENGRFIKGNKARTVAKQKKVRTKEILDETEMLQQEIYNESLRQLKDKLVNGELSSADLLRLNSNTAEFVTPKAPKQGRPKKKDVSEDLDNLLDILNK